MASLWRPLRLLPPLQSTFSPPLGLRACTPLQSRLLHTSPILAVRKSSKAVIKPHNPSATTRKKQQKDAIAREREDPIHIPFDTHSPRTAPSTPATHTPPTWLQQPVLNRSRQQQQQHQQQQQQQQHQEPEQQQQIAVQEPVEVYTPPPFPMKSALEYRPGGRTGVLASLRELDNAESPTLIYEATKARSYIAVCAFASIFLGCIAAMQVDMFNTDPSKSDLRIASVFLITALMWGILSSWAAWGATDVIKRIWAIPTATGKPLLRIEPVRLWGGKRPLPFNVRLGDVFSNKRFADEIAMFDATRPVRRQPGVLDALFEPVGTVYHSTMKMIMRKSSFAQLYVRNGGLWKVDLRDCKALEHGETMDLLILPMNTRHGWFASLFLQN